MQRQSTRREYRRFRIYSVDATGTARDVLVEMHKLFQGYVIGPGQSAADWVFPVPAESGPRESG